MYVISRWKYSIGFRSTWISMHCCWQALVWLYIATSYFSGGYRCHVFPSISSPNTRVMLRLHTTPNVSGPRRKPTTVCIVNVYAPTAQRAKKFPAEYETFYRELTRTVRACRRKSIAVFVAGDFNSKLGLQRQLEDGSDEQFMGKYGKGTRNQNGDSLVDFLTVQKLYAGNTHCRHKMCRRTTWRWNPKWEWGQNESA